MPQALCRVLVFGALFVQTAVASAADAGQEPLVFERDVRPLLKAHCFHCHGEAGAIEGNLDVRLQRFLVAGGDSGAAIVPGDHAESYLYQRLESGEMPPGDAHLGEAEIEIIARWIDEGAQTARPEPENLEDAPFYTDEERSFWSFQPIERPEVPLTGSLGTVHTPVDAFILSRLAQEGLTPSEEADRRSLIRRLYFDLWGLQPEPADIEAFVADPSPLAYANLVDRLLASPRYGERWGRHWLDIAGYADSEGYTIDDPVRSYAYKYRDYVIRSFNENKPFDEFVVEQLAGDELIEPPYQEMNEDAIEKLVATGFLRMAPDGSAGQVDDRKLAQNQVVAETVKIVSTSLLGLSVGCAECHDHRYDPISQVDYYSFRAIFAPVYNVDKWRVPRGRLVSLYTAADRELAAEIEAEAQVLVDERNKKQAEFVQATFEKELAELPEEIRESARAARDTPADKRTDEQNQLLMKYPSLNVSNGSLYLYDRKAADKLKEMAAEIAKVRARKPVEEFVRVATEVPGEIPETHLFFRGDYNSPRETVVPSEPAILAMAATDQSQLTAIPVADESRPTSGRRLAFAQSLTSGEHPLLPRVIVNRLWLHHFGRGLVATPADFGLLGERPSHPELLDWLASEFVASGWDVKHMHRLMLLSATYRQQSTRRPELDEVDPDNRLLARAAVRRLAAEELRDSMLAASGALSEGLYGEPVPVREDEVGRFVVGIENKDGEGKPGAEIDMGGRETRRSVYVQVRRSQPLSVLTTFDAPLMEPNCDLRSSSTVAPQSLMLMNSSFAIEQSRRLADRLVSDANLDQAGRIGLAWQRVFGREPSEAEVSEAADFLAAQSTVLASVLPADGKGTASPEVEAWATLCQALFSANEFLYVD